MTYFNEQLKTLQLHISQKAKLEEMLNDLISQKSELDKKVARLEAEKQNEQSDVDRLQGHSLAAFFYAVIGQKTEKLDKERKEAYAAAVKYDAALAELNAVSEDINRLENELKNYEGCKERYEQLLKEKTEAIKASNDQNAAQIFRMEQVVIEFDNQFKEIAEAISAGKWARNGADAVLKKLNRAETIATGVPLHGGVFIQSAKIDAIDEAQMLINELQIRLRRFKTELSHVKDYLGVRINSENFLEFSDNFYKGMFVYSNSLNKIQRLRSQIQNTKVQIDTVLYKLENMQTSAREKQIETKKQLNELILNI